MLDLEKLKQFLNEAGGFNGHNGIRYTVVEEGRCECQVEMGPQSLNPQGLAHGSLLFTLCDCATGVAACSVGRTVLTQSADIHFLRPGRGGTLTAKARLLKCGRTTALSACEVYDDAGRLLVTGQFDVFYTSGQLTLPERGEDGVWRSAEDSRIWGGF